MNIKRLFLALLLLSCAFAASNAIESNYGQTATLEGVRVAIYPKTIRVVLDFYGQAYYSSVTSESELQLMLLNSSPGFNLEPDKKINDWAVPKVETRSLDRGLLVKIPLPYPTAYEIKALEHPSRLVIDFDRSFTQIKKAGEVEPGIEYFSVIKSIDDDYVTAQVLEVDPKKVDVFPALAKPSESIMQSIAKFFTPWAQKKRPGFYKSRVSDIAEQYGAVCGINATYFDTQDKNPLGVLMIDQEMISYPISDRTALILTSDGRAFIDNIMMDAYLKAGEIKYTITGINEPRSSQKDMILYTPMYGELTKTDSSGYDISVEKGIVQSSRAGNIWIPENGYAISAGSLYAENMPSVVKLGDKVQVVVNVIPYSADVSGEAIHLIGGGPRLIKSGRVYISKYEEKFRPDISRGRASRTAVGITQDGHLLLVTVDGKIRKGKNGNKSIGMSLTELAYFLQSIGAYDALNLDGGGSTTMVVRGSVMNHPVDGSQRKVSNAILVKPQQ